LKRDLAVGETICSERLALAEILTEEKYAKLKAARKPGTMRKKSLRHLNPSRKISSMFRFRLQDKY
jgi:hypothetical protein